MVSLLHPVFEIKFVLASLYFSLFTFLSTFYSASVSLSTSDKLVSKLEMPAGSSIVLSMVSSLTARCLLTRLSVEETTLSTPSSARLEPASTCHVLSSSIWSPLL